MRQRSACLITVPLMLLLAVPAWGQVDTAAAQAKVLSKRAAEADAYRKLAEAIKGVRINSETTVRDFAAESDQIQAQLDAFIRGVRLGEPTWYDDLSCEVPAEVTVQRVVETLKTIHEKYYKGDRVTGKDIEQIQKRTQRNVFRVVGMGAPREDLPVGLPAGVEEQILKENGGPPIPPQPVIPDIWRQIGPRGRLMAIRAAEVDAMRKLMERIRGVRVTSNTLVKDFVAETDVIHAVANDTLVGFTTKGVYLHEDEPIAEVTLEIPVESVVRTIKELHARQTHGGSVKGKDIENMSERIKVRTFEATGMGVAPPNYLKRVEQARGMEYPEWATKPIVVRGQGVVPPDKAGSPQGRLLAIRAAEADAYRKLAEQVHGLELVSKTTVEDFVTRHDEIRTYVEALLLGATVQETSVDDDGVATAVVTLPGMEIWQAVNEERERDQR